MSGDHNQYQKDKSYLDFECPRCGHCCQTKGEELHLQAAAYANKRKEAYLDYVKKGEKLSEEMLGWVWMAHYEGYRDGMKGGNHE